jgi:diguanylate cyclase (GGDEF)-like protein
MERGETGCATETGSARPLDGLVTRTAVRFMPVSAATLDATVAATVQDLAEFFGVDTCFLRHNDIDRGVTVLIAEWPPRRDVPDPDPLGEVPFGADAVFDATRDLRDPFVIRPQAHGADPYQQRVEQGAGVAQVSMVMVPLIRGRDTMGVLGFVTFGDRPWSTEEINALQAVASLLVQLQARVEAEERLSLHAYHDDLTGLPNRRALMEELVRRLDPSMAQATILMYVDLDRFKSINDSLGHAAGDHHLLQVSDRLRAGTDSVDFVARLAGDEFIVLVPGPLPTEALHCRTQRLLATLARPVTIAGHHISRSACIGVAVGRPGQLTADDLLGAADAALQAAKRDGGGRAVVFDEELRAAAKERSRTEVLLRDALHVGGLQLHYQPEVDLRTGQLLAVEALLRWDHPERGFLTAGAFIDVAETSGLIVDLGAWVLGEACRQMAAWRRRYPHLQVTLRVNVSPAQFASGDMVEQTRHCLAAAGLPGRLLCLEITEHAVMQDIERSVQALHRLKLLGVSLAIDDFGTGFSSMSQLKRLPVDVLKIDQSFVAGLGHDGGDRAIVDATIRLASAFGLDVVAEGVEHPAVVGHLLELGCRRGQGFLLCRPKAPADLEPVLARGGFDPITLVQDSVATRT